MTEHFMIYFIFITYRARNKITRSSWFSPYPLVSLVPKAVIIQVRNLETWQLYTKLCLGNFDIIHSKWPTARISVYAMLPDIWVKITLFWGHLVWHSHPFSSIRPKFEEWGYKIEDWGTRKIGDVSENHALFMRFQLGSIFRVRT